MVEVTTLLQDVRHGLRVLWKSPGFAIVAVLSLALGVGAYTAIFSVVNAVLLRSLPFSHPERLVKIVASNRGVGARDIGLSVPEFDDLRSRAGVFDQVTATQGGTMEGERINHEAMMKDDLPKVTWEKIIEHIDHAVKTAGVDHVGLGSDFDGATMPLGMEDASNLPKITDALLKKGYSEADVEKIL